MELKRLVARLTYRIEPKPEGGFIAHTTDPTAPPLEAASREELLQKIQASISANLASEFPSLKLPLENQKAQSAFHIEPTPEGGFAIHSADPNAPPVETVTHEKIESRLAEKLIGLMGKDIMPELQALAAQGKAGDIQVVVKRSMGSTAHALDLGFRRLPKTTTADFSNVGNTIGNSPIIPERSSAWSIFGFFLAWLAVSALVYFFFHHR